MKKLFTTVLALACIACAKDIVEPTAPQQTEISAPATRIIIESDEDQITLGQKLTNPYSVDVMNAAVQGLYGEVDFFDPNYYYVRFLPEDSLDVKALIDSDLELYDYPLDYEISGGNYYHDPQIDADKPTWMYTVVPVGYQFSNISMRYEILEECFIPDDGEPEDWGVGINSNVGGVASINGATNNLSIDLEEVERRAYIISGNGDMLEESPKTRGNKSNPMGFVKYYDNSDSTAYSLVGVTVRANRFVKIGKAISDAEGFYEVNKSFNNQKGAHINVVFKSGIESFGVYKHITHAKATFKNVPCTQVSTLCIFPDSTASSVENVEYDRASDDAISWSAATIFNATTKYYKYSRAAGIPLPPSNLRIALFVDDDSNGAAPMFSEYPHLYTKTYAFPTIVAALTGVGRITLVVLVNAFAWLVPDIFIDYSSMTTDDISLTTFHELAHASHYTVVRNSFWGKYIDEIVKSSLATDGDELYGETGPSPHCLVGEMWAEYYSRMLACIDGDSTVNNNKIVGRFDDMDIGKWIRPQVLVNIAIQLGLDVKDVYNAVIGMGSTASINSGDKLKESLVRLYGSTEYDRDVINHEFDCYYKGYDVSYCVRNTSPMQRYIYTYVIDEPNDTIGVPLWKYMEAKSVTEVKKVNCDYHDITKLMQMGVSISSLESPFIKYAAIYDTNVMDMPLREYYADSVQIHNFFEDENWILDELDTLNLNYKYIYETDF